MKDKNIIHQEEITWGKHKNLGDSKQSNDYECCEVVCGGFNTDELIRLEHSSKSKIREFFIIPRGENNIAPQNRKELGKKTGSHRSIADKISTMAAGKAFRFVPNKELTDNEKETIQENAKIFLNKGINQARHRILNGVVYENISPVIITERRPNADEIEQNKTSKQLVYMAFKKPETLRKERTLLDNKGEEYSPTYHFSNDWENCDKDTIPLKEYINIMKSPAKSLLWKGKNPAFYVYSRELLDRKNIRGNYYIGDYITGAESIFDESYPMPKWASESTINDIKNEYLASEIRKDYLENGLHIMAIVNCYSRAYNDSEGGITQTAKDQQKADRDTLLKVKGHANSGKLIIRYIGTNDIEKDGKIEIEEINLEFNSETFGSITTQSYVSVLIAWGVNPKLFSLPDISRNGLSSTSKEMEIAVLNLESDIAAYQSAVINWLNREAIRYGVFEEGQGGFIVENLDGNIKTALMQDLAKEVMTINEIRTKMLGEIALEQDELVAFLNELTIRKGKQASPQESEDNE